MFYGGKAMKRKTATLSLFTLTAAILFLLCSCEGIGYDPPAVTTEVIDTTPPLYDPTASPVELLPEEESEIIRNYIIYKESNRPETDYKVRCFGSENGAYAVFVELVGYVPIDYEDFLEAPNNTPMTRDYDFWYEIGDPLMIYKDGKFYRLRELSGQNIVTGDFLNEVYELYKTVNPGFYDKEW